MTKDALRSGAQMASDQVWKKESLAEEGAHVQHVLCDETNRIRRTRRWLCFLRRVNRPTGGTRRHLSAVAMKALTSGHKKQFPGIVDGLARNPREPVKKFEE